MSTTRVDIPLELKRAGVRFGYAVAVVVNLAMLIIVQNILEWGWLPFLTDQFATVEPWISFSLIVSIVANLIYQVNDSPDVKSTGQIMMNLVFIPVTAMVLTVFPFDYSTSSFDWTLVTRIVLILGIAASAVGLVSEVVMLVNRQRELKGGLV